MSSSQTTRLSASVNAQPFKPSAAASSAGGAAGRGLASTLNATPFTPVVATQGHGVAKPAKPATAAATTHGNNVNAQPFMPGLRAGPQQVPAPTASAATLAGALPDLPDELTQDEPVGGDGYVYVEDDAPGGKGEGVVVDEVDESEFGIDAAMARLTVEDVSTPLQPGHSRVASQFMSDQLYQFLAQRQQLTFAYVDPAPGTIPAGDFSRLPPYIHVYHSLLPLEDIQRPDKGRVSASLGISTRVLKGVSAMDGLPYALWRLSDVHVPPNKDSLHRFKAHIRRWSSLAAHPHVIGVRDAFLSADLANQPALFAVYGFHPKAATLEQVYLASPARGPSPSREPIDEDALWGLAVQIGSLLIAVHAQKLFLGASLSASKLVLTHNVRLRANAAGLPAFLEELRGKGAERSIEERQAEDVWRAGQMLMQLACRTAPSLSANVVERLYSREFNQLLLGAMTVQDKATRNGAYFCRLLGARAFSELTRANAVNDMLHENLYKELQNGRLLRLLVKLGMINERRDDARSMQWSDSGDRYLLKLFRDFVFHQQSEDGSPNLDWGHVLESLNKLDAGIKEQLMLVSRDEKSVLVVSYKDMNQAVHSAYEELRERTNKTKPASWR